MNFYVDSGGVVLHVEPERIFQGSANANTIRFIGAFAPNLPVLVAFKLPNGVWTTPQSMGFSAQLSGVETNDGVQFNAWEYQIPQVITENYGTVNVQFYVYGDAGGTGGQIASAMSSFVVEKGVPITLPDPTDDYQTLLTQILAVLSQLQSEIGDLPNNYVPKASGSNVAYINDQNGGTATKPFAVDVTNNALVARDGNGQIRLPLAPLQGYDAVSKNYVDDADNTKLNKVEPFANGTYAYIVSKDDRFGTTNGYTEISEKDKISTIAKRKTNGCIETRTPYADIEAANKGYVDTAISDTQSQLAQTNQNVEDLYTILEQAQVVTVTTLEQAYTTRETADGENIVDGIDTSVKEIRGKTVAPANLIPYPYFESSEVKNGVTFTINEFDGSVVLSGVSTSAISFGLTSPTFYLPAGTYFFSLNSSKALSDSTIFGIVNKFQNGSFVGDVAADYGNGDFFSVSASDVSSNSGYRFEIFVRQSGVSCDGYILYPMLNAGSSALPYKPYFKGLKNASFEKIVSTGRNLFGLTADDFKNGAIAGEGKRVDLKLKPNTQYTLSSNTPKYSEAAASIWFNSRNSLTDGVCTNQPRTATTDEKGNLYIVIRTTEIDTIFNNYWIMLNIGTTATAYEPYTSDTLSVKTPIELAEYDVAYPETGETKRNSGKKVFDGTETWEARGSAGDLYRYGAVLANVKTSGACVANLSGENSGASVAGNYFIDTEFKVFTNIATVDEWKAHLAEIATAGNPLTVIYETAEATTEATPFNKSKYIAWKNGSETIEQGANDNSEYGAENTVKQDYFTLTGGTTNV